MRAAEDGGHVVVRGRNGSAHLAFVLSHPSVSVHNTDGSSGAGMSIGEYGGYVSVKDKNGFKILNPE